MMPVFAYGGTDALVRMRIKQGWAIEKAFTRKTMKKI